MEAGSRCLGQRGSCGEGGSEAGNTRRGSVEQSENHLFREAEKSLLCLVRTDRGRRGTAELQWSGMLLLQ
jgi:hypothetical protein